jgi:CHAT domain-containing protein
MDLSVINLFDEFSHPSVPRFTCPVDFSKIDSVLRELNKDVNAIDNVRLRQFGKLLWNLLIPPEIRGHLATLERSYAIQLLFMTNDLQIPWEIIHDDFDFWALKYTMGRIYGSDEGHVRFQQWRKKRVQYPPLLLIYDPAQNLDGAKREGGALRRALKDKFSITPLTGRQTAYDLALEIGSDKFDIIHFAGHAQMGKKGGLLAADRELSSREIAQYSLARHPIVFANACATGVAGGYYGARSLSIAEAFIKAGASAFIGTLWKTDDDISARFASCVYFYLKSGCTIGDALLRARKELWENPKREDIDWAAFALFGSPDSRLYGPLPREGIVTQRVQVTMSNAPGTLARVLQGLSKCRVNIVQGRSITFDNEKTAGYVAEIEVPSGVSDVELLKAVKGRVKGLVYHLEYIN